MYLQCILCGIQVWNCRVLCVVRDVWNFILLCVGKQDFTSKVLCWESGV